MKSLAEPLSATAIRGALARPALRSVAELHVCAEIDSTNRRLLDQVPPAPGELVVCLAEHQTAGRGRRGRSWYAPPGGSLCLSVGWSFETIPRDVSALTLAAGVVLRRALQDTTGLSVSLKWPNDLVVDDKKLGGILVELRSDDERSCYLVIGVGLNIALDASDLARVSDWPKGAVDLSSVTYGPLPSRNILAARFIEALWQLLRRYSDSGFATYRPEYAAADYLRGREISIDGERPSFVGRAAGVDDAGMLLVDCGGGVERVIAGEVSVRPAP